MEAVILGNRLVGPGSLPYIIAEIGANHNGDIDLAKRLIDRAKVCGADAVKFQAWSKKSLISRAEYVRNTEYDDKKRHFGSLEDMVERYQLGPNEHKELAAYCTKRKITFLSSAFSPVEVDMLSELNVPAFKTASMDINNISLLEYVGGKGKPVILSTGMASLGEISQALEILKRAGVESIILMHCVSLYPPPDDIINLRNICAFQQVFDMLVGFSDHTIGTCVSTAAVALGACAIEKHFTLDKNMEGWDHSISADPIEFSRLVRDVQQVYRALGSTVRRVDEMELKKREVFRRSIVASRRLKEGTRLIAKDLDFKRPGTGIRPDELKYVLNRKLCRDIESDEELKWSDLDDI